MEPMNASQSFSPPPVVVYTVPQAGSEGIRPGLVTVSVTFSRPMTDHSWSWTSAWPGSVPEFVGQPEFLEDFRTCHIQARLDPDRTYGFWLNSRKFRNFKDRQGQPALPYLLTFKTGRC